MRAVGTSTSNNDLQNKINNPNSTTCGINQITNSSNNKAPTVKIPRDMPTKSLQIRKVVSNVLLGLGVVAAAVVIAAAVASIAFAVVFLLLAAIVGIGIASVALLITGIILRFKKDTLSEENLPEVIKLLAEKNENYIKSNVNFVNKVIEFCDKEKDVENLEKNRLLPDIIKILAKSDEKVITSNKDFVGKIIKSCKNKELEDLKKNGLLPDIIKILAKSDKEFITSNKDFVGKVIKFCKRNEILGTLIDEECGTSIESPTETLKKSNIDNAKGLTENLKSINKNYDLIQSISFLKEGEKVYDAGKEEADFQNITLSLQKNNDTKASDETISFFENQENKNKFIELAENHTCGIMKYDAVIDNNGTISKFEKGPNRAFLLPKKENNVDKKSKDTENYDVNLNGIEKQSKKDFTQPVILIIDNKEINIDNKEIKAKNLDDLEKKIRENFSNNADKIIKKILSFPGQSCCEFNLAIQSFFFEEKGRSIIPKTETIQFKIEITNDDVYLYACSKYKIFNGDSQSYEPFCIEESKKYRLNDQEKGKYTVPTLLAEHIAVFEAKPYVTENDELAYLEIGEKKSEFNWINPKPEELVTFNVVNNAVNDEKK